MDKIIMLDGKKMKLTRRYFWETNCPAEKQSYYDSQGRYVVVSEPIYHPWHGEAGNYYEEYEPVEQ
jgi:hypothetical protein